MASVEPTIDDSFAKYRRRSSDDAKTIENAKGMLDSMDTAHEGVRILEGFKGGSLFADVHASNAHMILAEYYTRNISSDPKKARFHLTESTRLNAPVHNNDIAEHALVNGLTLKLEKNDEDAINSLEKCLREAEQIPAFKHTFKARFNLFQLFVQRGQYQAAKNLMPKLQTAKGDDAKAYDAYFTSIDYTKLW